MATARWIGASLNRRQVDLITMTGAGDWVAGDTITCTVSNVDYILTIGTLVTDIQVALSLYQGISGTSFTDTTASGTISAADGGANSIAQMSEFTATSPTTGVLTVTGNGTGALAGKPYTLTVAENSTGDDTAVLTSSVVPTSQYHADQVDNYSGNALPTGGSDTLIFDNGNVDVRWGMDYATTLTKITKYKTYTGNVGLSEINSDNSSKPYHEYRTTYLTCTGCTTVDLEVGDGPGSGRFKLNTGSAAASAINVYGKGTRAESGVPCILWKGTHASNTVSNLAGDIGIAFFGSETATVATLVTGDGPSSQASTICGIGTTLTTVRMNGGYQSTNSAITTATQNAGNWQHFAGTVTTLTVNSGTFYVMAALTITTANVYGMIDLSRSAGTVTFTNLVNIYGNGHIYDPNNKATFSAGYKLNSATAKVTRGPGDIHSIS